MTENGRDIDQIARDMIAEHGQHAVRVLRERAELADGIGDEPSARAWREIAKVAASILRHG
jgi:hypothetical protein